MKERLGGDHINQRNKQWNTHHLLHIVTKIVHLNWSWGNDRQIQIMAHSTRQLAWNLQS